MKKLLLSVAILASGFQQLSAQCVIGPACSTNTIGYCAVPSENTALPNGTAGTAYSTDINFTIATSVMGGMITLTDATISAVNGLPAGLTYSTNPANGNFPGGASACLNISGTPTVAGIYTVAVNFDINTSMGPTNQTLNWGLLINLATGVTSVNKSAQVIIAPNPASNELSIATANHFSNIQIIDALGKTVLSQHVNYTNQTTIDISTLSKGVYFIQLNEGDKLITKKFIKE